MGKYDDLFDTGPAPSFSPGTTVPQVYVDEAAQRLAQEKASGVGKYADLFDEPAPAATSPSNDVARALEGTAQAKQALGLLLDPLAADWSQSQPITSVSGPARENPDELASYIPNEKLRHLAAGGANILAGFVPKSLDDIKQMLAPQTYQRFQEDIARSKPEYEAVEKTPPFSQERIEHYGNLGAQILFAASPLHGALKPELTRADLDAKIAAAQAQFEAKPEPAPTEAIRAKLEPHPAQDLISERNRLVIEELPKQGRGTNGEAYVQSKIIELDKQIEAATKANRVKIGQQLIADAQARGETLVPVPGQSETRLPVEDLPSEQSAPSSAKTAPARPQSETVSDTPVQDVTVPAQPQPEVIESQIASPKIPAADESASGIGAYHGSNVDFTEFDPAKSGTNDAGYLGKGTYFSTDLNAAKLGSSKIYQSKLNLSNPLKIELPNFKTDKRDVVRKALDLPETATADEVTQAAKARGHDGVILDYSPTGYAHQEIAVFDPTGIKAEPVVTNAETNPSPAGTGAELAPEKTGPALGKGDVPIAPAQEPANVPGPVDSGAGEPANPFDTSATGKRLTELRDSKPRPVEKLYGPNPTDTQRIGQELKIRQWNNEYRKAQKAHKEAVEKSNEWLYQQKQLSSQGTEGQRGPAVQSGTSAITGAGETQPASPPEPVVTSTKNAVTAAEREARGLPEAEQAARRDFGTVWDQAAAEAEKDPAIGQRLVDSLESNPRALSDKENALLLRRQIEVQSEHDAAIQHQNDNPGNPDAQARLDAARNELQRVYDAGKAAGTETGRGLNARKMLAANDFSLSKMEAETRAVVNKGEPLSADQAAQIKALHERINAAESKLAGYEAQEQFRRELKAAQVAKQPRPEFLRQSYESAKARIQSRRGRLYAGIDPTSLFDEAVVGAYHLSRGIKEFGQWSVEMVKEFGEAIKPHLQTIFEKARALHAETNRSRGPLTEEQRLAGAKSRASLQTEIIKHKLETGDITKPKRPGPIRPDRELLQLRGELQRHKDAFNTLLEKGRRANMSFGERAAETFVRGERAIKLTGIHTLGKLAGAGVTRLVTTPLEQAVGGILNKIPILSRIAAEAPREGRGSFRAETVGVGRGLARGVRNIPKILKGVRTNEEALYGKQNFHYESGSVLDIPGRTHGALKSPFKEAERERSTILRQRQAQRKGLDPTEAATEQEIGQAAHMDAQRAIFMQDNILSDVFRGGIRMLENSKKFPTAGFYLAKTANFLLPIVKVPTNIAIETGVHLGGTLSGSGKLIGVMSRGLKNIKPEEADMIMRHYKKGAIGIGLFLTGYFNSSKFGGYYVEHDKRKSTDVRWGGARFNGVDIPAWLLHAPAFLVLQAGATFRRVLDKKGEKKTATLATVKGVVNDIPFVREMSVIDSMLAAGYEGDRERGSLLASSIVPQGVKDVATMLDQQDAQGNPVRRYPRNELDYIKMSIPGLRQEVPLHKAMMKRKLLLR